MKLKRLFFFYFLAILPLISYCEEIQNKKEILFICSYSTDNDFSRSNISSFVDTYTELKGEYIYSTEGLNCTSFNDRFRWVNDVRMIMQKHKDASLVILLGTEAIISYFSLTEPEIRKIPVFATMGQRYCCSLNTNEIPSLYRNDGNYGIVDINEKAKNFNLQLFYYYDYSIKKDIEFIKSLFPNTKNIAIISDNTVNGLSHLRQVKEAIRKDFKDMRILYVDGRRMNTEQAATYYNSLPANTTAMLCGWKYDKDQVAYMSNAKYSFNKANPNIPVFSLTGTSLGNWAIGGYIPNYRPLGEELAKKAYDLLETGKWNGPYISNYTDTLKIDLAEIKRWNLMDVKLPSDAIYLNPEFSWKDYIEFYKWYFIMGASIFILITIGFIFMTINNIHIRILKKNLEKKDEQLENEKIELLKYHNELIIAKDKADESSRLQSAFVSNMSHEIRTPLNAIVGFSDVLVSSITPTEEQKEYIDIINHNTNILLKLINDILDLSRIESKTKSFYYERTDIIPSLESTVISLQPNAQEGVNILFTHKEDTMVIDTDIVRLQQIVINLIGNAIKFTNKGSITLNVEKSDQEGMLEFSVTDTGCGIPVELQECVFERFKKVNEFVQGTGLGLSICQATVKEFGGKIWIDQSYSDGARFIFTIPTCHKEKNDKE